MHHGYLQTSRAREKVRAWFRHTAHDANVAAGRALLERELRRLAAAKMAHEAPGQTLQPTALVHEAWMRLGGDGQRALAVIMPPHVRRVGQQKFQHLSLLNNQRHAARPY